MTSEDRFGYEWNKYSDIEPDYEDQFRRWIQPLDKSFFKGKSVLDVGCGMGRNSYWVLDWGAREVVSFDYDNRSVAAAKRNLQSKNAKVYLKSIYEINWKDEFDIAFSIGVIHHLRKPKKAIEKMVQAVKPGGTVAIWVYGYEGNEWIVYLVNPIRKHITSKLPVSFVHFLAFFCSVPLWIFVKIFKGSGKYLKQLSTFTFSHVHSIVFDQLIPEIAHYWKKDDVLGLFKDNSNITVTSIIHTNDNSWTVVAKKKKEGE